jgi:hypothetical protein
MGRDLTEETQMTRRPAKKLVREGDLVAEVPVELVETDGGWTPYLSMEDAYKLDDVREALRAGDVRRAAQLAERVYRLTPVDA